MAKITVHFMDGAVMEFKAAEDVQVNGGMIIHVAMKDGTLVTINMDNVNYMITDDNDETETP